MAGILVKESFRDAFTQADLIAGATLAVVAGAWSRLGAYVVPAGEVVSIGFGQHSGQEDAVGRLSVLLKNATVEIMGKIRLSVYSPQDRPLQILGEYRTNVLSANATDRTKHMPFPEHRAWIQEDQKLILEFLPDTSETLTKAGCVILMDCTKGVV